MTKLISSTCISSTVISAYMVVENELSLASHCCIARDLMLPITDGDQYMQLQPLKGSKEMQLS